MRRETKISMVALFVAAVLMGGSAAKAQTSSTVKDDLFAGTEKFAQNASSVTEVDMDPDSLDMVKGHNESRARRTVLSVVHTYSYDKPGMYNMADVEAFRNKLNTGDWHCSVHTRELKTGESTDICRKHRTDDLEETAIITVEPKELTFIHRIQRPSQSGSGKSGGPSEAYYAPYGMGFGTMEGMPAQAWRAEERARTAEMRALAMADRAEFVGMMPGMRVNVYTDGLQGFTMPAINLGRMDELNRQLQNMPRYELRRVPAAPASPSAPKAPAAPKAPSASAGPQGASEKPSVLVAPLASVRQTV